MKSKNKTRLAIAVTAFFATCAVTTFFMREPTVILTAEGLAAARAKWLATGFSDYDLDYLMNGNRCEVVVRAGIVESLHVNGAPASASQLRFYSVRGLFDTLEMDLDSVEDGLWPAALVRVRFHPVHGYVERYIRGSGGIGRGAEIEQLVLNPMGSKDAPETN